MEIAILRVHEKRVFADNPLPRGITSLDAAVEDYARPEGRVDFIGQIPPQDVIPNDRCAVDKM